MKFLFPLLMLIMLTKMIAIKVLTTTDDIKHLKGNNWIKLDIKDINGELKPAGAPAIKSSAAQLKSDHRELR